MFHLRKFLKILNPINNAEKFLCRYLSKTSKESKKCKELRMKVAKGKDGCPTCVPPKCPPPKPPPYVKVRIVFIYS